MSEGPSVLRGLCPVAFACAMTLRRGADSVDVRSVSFYRSSLEPDRRHVLGSRSQMLPGVSFRLVNYLEMCFYFRIFINSLNFLLLLPYNLTLVVEGHTCRISALSGVFPLVPWPGTWSAPRGVHAPAAHGPRRRPG